MEPVAFVSQRPGELYTSSTKTRTETRQSSSVAIYGISVGAIDAILVIGLRTDRGRGGKEGNCPPPQHFGILHYSGNKFPPIWATRVT